MKLGLPNLSFYFKSIISLKQKNQKIYKYPHICVGMATKNISITEEAYMRLAMLKKERESFSEVISRITALHNLNRFFGILSKGSGEVLEENLIKIRKNQAKANKKRIQKLKKMFQQNGMLRNNIRN